MLRHLASSVRRRLGDKIWCIRQIENLDLLAPDDVQIEKISLPDGGSVDWQVAERNDAGQRIALYFAKRVTGALRVNVAFDAKLRPDGKQRLPLLQVPQAERQRGLVGFIATKDAALRVDNEESLLRISEARLNEIITAKDPGKLTFAFKYQDVTPDLVVSPIPPGA